LERLIVARTVVESPAINLSIGRILIGLVPFLASAAVLAASQHISGDSGAGDWLYVDHDLTGSRYSPLKQITTENVSRLAKVCAYTFPEKEPSQTAPIVSAGRMYLTTAR
jgi:glucose dehydrogenase